MKNKSVCGACGSTLRVVSTEMLAPHLTDEQLECLSRCAKGISLRFEAPEIVAALVAGGYVEEGVARVVTVTAKGLKYLQTLAS
jgi:hypothetical protein